MKKGHKHGGVDGLDEIERRLDDQEVSSSGELRSEDCAAQRNHKSCIGIDLSAGSSFMETKRSERPRSRLPALH